MNRAAVTNPSLGLLTDLYELTMAYGYWKNGIENTEAAFHLAFRRNPFKGGYAIACGLSQAVEYLLSLSYSEEAVAYLATLVGGDGRPLFEPAFLQYLRNMKWRCDVDAVPEGTVVFANEPMVRVQGPLLQAQLVETALLNMINYQTLVATKAARICLAAKGDPVVEFGLRRAQGMGGLVASRAAYVGGCESTSNVLAGQLYGIPVRGTHAHAWVMAFASELESFRAYARIMPNNCVFLVDTYNTRAGVAHAIEAGRELRTRGYEFAGIRLDSGDLAYLSIEARRMLDEAGFPRTLILASNDLDEYTIASIKQQGGRIDVWGVGTRLVTGHDEPALGGVYKLAAIRRPGESWQNKIKLSEQPAKISIPGRQQVRRFSLRGEFAGDMIYDLEQPPGSDDRRLLDPFHETRSKTLPSEAEWEDLLVPIIRDGTSVYEEPTLAATRARAQAQLARLHPGTRRFLNPHEYPVGLSPALYELRRRLIMESRGAAPPKAS
jgi:nicotinate phosphoribosyltransferase